MNHHDHSHRRQLFLLRSGDPARHGCWRVTCGDFVRLHAEYPKASMSALASVSNIMPHIAFLHPDRGDLGMVQFPLSNAT
eukprot:6194004-Amphidinium_carterae.2